MVVLGYFVSWGLVVVFGGGFDVGKFFIDIGFYGCDGGLIVECFGWFIGGVGLKEVGLLCYVGFVFFRGYGDVVGIEVDWEDVDVFF